MRRQHAARRHPLVPDEPVTPRVDSFTGSDPPDAIGGYDLLASALDTERHRPIEATRVFFENSPDAFFVISIDANDKFRIEEFNPPFAKLFGATLRGSRGKELQQILPLDIARLFNDSFERCCQAHMQAPLEVAMASGPSVQRWEFRLTAVRGFLGRIDRILGHGGIVRDEGPVDGAESTQLLHCIARTTRDVLYVVDRAMKRRLYLNDRVQDVAGYRSDEIRGMSREALKQLIHPDDVSRVRAHYRDLDAFPPGETKSIEYRIRSANGHYVWLSGNDTVLVSADGTRRIVGCVSDMTDQRHALANVKQISKRLLRTQDEERRRIARELHDSTTQHLVAVSIGLTRLGMIDEQDSDVRIGRRDVLEILAEMRKSISEAQHEIRALSYLLHPPALERMGLSKTLRRFVAGFARRTHISAELTIQEGLVCRSHDISTALLRVAQEALINVYRHAGASRVDVRLSSQDQHLVLEIEDDGKGFGSAFLSADDDIESIGVGIPGMRARVRQFRGDLEVLPGRQGALVRATIPELGSRLD